MKHEKNKPILPDRIYLLKYGINMLKYPFMSDKSIFQEIYRKNIWGNKESASGHGSTISQTSSILKQLPILIDKFKIDSMLDIPCGDFHWMSKLELSLKYTGADIVDEIIEINNNKFFSHGDFHILNICKDPLPENDLIFCRDCLVHFSYSKIFQAINNIILSGSKYALLTTFPQCNKNFNTLTGTWRALNFQKPPFNFPEPIEIIHEKSNYRAEKYGDKSLALWKLSDLKMKGFFNA